MKFFKSLFILSFFTFSIISCTPESIEEELTESQLNTIQSYKTGGNDGTGGGGGKN